MNSVNAQRGYGTFLFIAVLGLLSISSAYYYETRLKQSNVKRESYETAAEEMRILTSSLTSYYRENSSWPSSLNDLVTGGYFQGDASRCGGGGTFQSSFCTTIFGSQVGDSYSVSFNALKETIADSIANQVPGGVRSGVTVSATIQKPFQSALYDDYIQRQSDPLREDRTRVEVGIDINDNDLLNIGTLNADSATILTADITSANINTAISKTVNLGENSLEYAGRELSLNASTISVNSDVSLANDTNARGFDVVGANNLNGQFASLNSVTANNGTIDNITGDNFTASEGSFSDISGDKLSYLVGDINKLDGNNLNFNFGTVSDLRGTDVNFSAGIINNLSGSNLNFELGTLNSLSGIGLTYFNIGGTNTLFTNLGASGAIISELTVLNHALINSMSSLDGDATRVNVINARVTNLNSNNGKIGSGIIDSANGVAIAVSGNSGFTSLESDNINAISVVGGVANVENGSVTGDLTANNVDSDTLSVSGLLSTVNMETNNANLGVGSASSLGVTGALNTLNLNISTANLTTANITSANVKNGEIDSVIANSFTGGRFNSDDDFLSTDSSVNRNHALMSEQQALLTNCIEVSKYCIPQDPVISLSCSSCNSSSDRDFFSGTVVANISSCRQGCSYHWVTSGSDLNFRNCNSGFISAGDTSTESCDVSASLSAQESVSGSVRLVVVNTLHSSKVSASTINVSYQNTAPGNTLENTASYITEFVGDLNNNGTTIYPTIDGKTFDKWNETSCPDCTWTVRFISGDVEFRYDTEADRINSGAQGDRCLDVSADGYMSMTISNPRGESVSFDLRLGAESNDYNPFDC